MDHLINSIAEYVMWTETTAVYPRNTSEQAREYEVLGALSEIGEICGMLKREIRDPDYTLERLQLKLELGDIAWYLARIHYQHTFDEDEEFKKIMADMPKGMELEGTNCFSIAGSLFNHYKPIVTSDAAIIKLLLGITHESHPKIEDAIKVAERVAENATEHNVIVMKNVLDLRASYHTSITRLIFQIAQNVINPEGLLHFFILCDRLRFDMLDVMRANYRKLEDRKERGAIHGSGDTR